MGKRYSKKKIKKLVARKCFFCSEDNPAVLDAHRIVPGEDGGKYLEHNMLVCCSNCHRKVHAGEIKIDRKYTWSGPGFVVHYWINGEEKWERETPPG